VKLPSLDIDTPAELVAAWDAGDIVHTVELGGLGPGYEQTIHILVFELLHSAGPLPEDGKFGTWGDDVVERLDKEHGFSGAQVGAAKSFAAAIIKHGMKRVREMAGKDRSILVSRRFPGGGT
jgi:hypothetical protein